jgi:hypothetical protein
VSKAVKLLAHALFWVSLVVSLLSVVSLVTHREPSSPLTVIFAYGIGFWIVLAIMFRAAAKLATRFERGELFAADNVADLRRIGWLALLTTVSPELVPGTEQFELDLAVSPSAAFVGLLLIFVSWVLDEARAIKDESDLVI